MTESKKVEVSSNVQKDFGEISNGLIKMLEFDQKSCERIISKVEKLLAAEPCCFEERIEQHKSFADLNRRTWKQMIGHLPEHQRLAFECLLEEELRELFYAHYIAVYLGTDAGKKQLRTN